MATKPARPPRATGAWVWTLVITSAVYASSSLHRLAGGDSGELLAEACVGGNAHPPGYPLLLLLLRLLRCIGHLVCPHVAMVVLANALNTALAAGAAACVSHVVELLAGREQSVEAVAAGLLFAFSALTWEYALGLEVFALNNLLVALLLACFVRHCLLRRQSRTALYAGALLCGLGLVNQHTIVLFEIPMILWIVASTKLRLLDWVHLTFAFTLGASPYAYTFFAAQVPTRGSWGDASTVSGLLTHLLRREYGTFRLSPKQGPSDTFTTRLAFYARDTIAELTPFGVLAATVGVLSSLLVAAFANRPADLESRRIARILPLVLTVYLVVFNALANLPLDDPLPREVTRRFFLQPNLALAVLSGLGTAALRGCCLRRSRALSQLLRVATVALVAHQFLRNRDRFTTSTIARHDLLRGLGRAVLEDLPRHAVLLSYTDIQWNAVRYVQACEHARPDVVHLNLQVMAFPWFARQHGLYPQIVFPATLADASTNRTSQGYAAYLTRFVGANFAQHELFLDLHGVDESTIASDQLLFGVMQVLPHGFVWKIVQIGATSQQQGAVVTDHWQAFATRGPHLAGQSHLEQCCGLSVHGDDQSLQLPRGSWEFVVASIAHDAIYQHALAKLGFWLAHGTIQDLNQLERAVVAFHGIQHALNELVWSGVQATDGAITYDLYAVQKNTVVSRQRFQLYLEVLAELVEQGYVLQAASDQDRTRLQSLLEERDVRRNATIAQVESFLVIMESRRDSDAEALRHGIETLQSKRTAHAAKQAASVDPASHKPQRSNKMTKTKTKTKKTRRKPQASETQHP